MSWDMGSSLSVQIFKIHGRYTSVGRSFVIARWSKVFCNGFEGYRFVRPNTVCFLCHFTVSQGALTHSVYPLWNASFVIYETAMALSNAFFWDYYYRPKYESWDAFRQGILLEMDNLETILKTFHPYIWTKMVLRNWTKLHKK